MVADDTCQRIGHSRGDGDHRGGGDVQHGRFQEDFGELSQQGEVGCAIVATLSQLRNGGRGEGEQVAQQREGTDEEVREVRGGAIEIADDGVGCFEEGLEERERRERFEGNADARGEAAMTSTSWWRWRSRRRIPRRRSRRPGARSSRCS